jgi:chorismate synthase
MPVIFSCAFKPTPSIGGEQESVSLARREDTIMAVKGRHDPCIVPRAVPVVEAAAAVAVVDLLLD